jgi:hypothetical protein
MKALNATATETMNKMVSMLEDGYIKIDNTDDSFMPVSVEQIFENDKFKQISIAHYYEQNGDLLADPEMILIFEKASGLFIPSYFKQDNLGVEQESVIMNLGKIVGVRTKMQVDHAIFANLWLRNIKQQQNL